MCYHLKKSSFEVRFPQMKGANGTDLCFLSTPLKYKKKKMMNFNLHCLDVHPNKRNTFKVNT